MRRISSPRRMWVSLRPVAGAMAAGVVCVCLLGGAVVWTYSGILFGDWSDVAGGYDVYRAVGPLCYAMDNAIHHGELPLWNPLTLCGMPFAANPVTSFFYPANLLRSLLSFHPTPFKTQVGWVLLTGAHLILAGLTLIALARDHRLSYPAAFTAAFAFMFSAIWTRRVCEYHFITMVCWVPLMMLFTRWAFSQPRLRQKAWYGTLCGILFGFALLSGAANIAPYMAVTLVAYALFFRCTHLCAGSSAVRSGAGAQGRIVHVLLGDALFIGLMFLFAVLIGSAFLIPGSEFAALSARVKASDYTLATPQFRGSARDLYYMLIRFPGLKWQTENIRGAGVGALLLVLAGLTHRNRREWLCLLALFLVLLDCSLGKPFPASSILYRISPIQMIASTRAFDFALIPLGLLAGFGVDAMTLREGSRVWRAMRSVLLLVVGIVLLHSLAGLLGPHTFLGVGPIGWVIPAIALAVTVLASWVPGRVFWRAAICALVFGETLLWNLEYVPFIAVRKDFSRWAGVYEGAETFWADNRRGTDPIQNRHLYTLRPAMHGYEPVHISRVREVLSGGRRAHTYQRSVKDYEVTRENHRGNLFLKRSFWLARQFVRGPLRQKHSLFPAATTVYLPEVEGVLPVKEVEEQDLPLRAVSEQAERIDVLTPGSLDRLREKLASGGGKRSLVLPRVQMPGVHSALRVEFKSDCGVEIVSTFREGTRGNAQFGKTVRIHSARPKGQAVELPLPDFVELQAHLTFQVDRPGGRIDLDAVYLLADRADENHLIEVVSRRMNSVVVQVGELPDFRVLTFLDAAYPGWRAFIDGHETPIMRANDAFKAVLVPPGTHRVVFRFRPASSFIGMGVSGISLGAAVLLLVVLGPAKRPREARPRAHTV